MKKLLFLIIVFIIISFSSLANNLETLKKNILSCLAHGLIAAQIVTVYLADDSFLESNYISNDTSIRFVNDCKSAQLIVTGSLKNLSKQCLKKPIFATNYMLYKNSSVIGVLFWQKGRPVIILKKEVLKKEHLKVKSYLEKYLQ